MKKIILMGTISLLILIAATLLTYDILPAERRTTLHQSMCF